MVRPVLASRVESIEATGHWLEVLSPAEVNERIEAIRAALEQAEAWIEDEEMDTLDLLPEEVRLWLGNLQPHDQVVEACWVSLKEGLRISYGTFVSHYDDLWLPAADDVLVSDRTLSWVLELDHEEIFRLRRRRHV